MRLKLTLLEIGSKMVGPAKTAALSCHSVKPLSTSAQSSNCYPHADSHMPAATHPPQLSTDPSSMATHPPHTLSAEEWAVAVPGYGDEGNAADWKQSP